MDFIYERFKTPQKVKIEVVSGGGRYSGKVWLEIARQIYCENGRDGFREIGHFNSGAPFLYDADEKISISHTQGCLAVATIKVNPDTNLSLFSPESALGVDVERADREKARELRERYLTSEEMALVPDTTEASVLAWTCKEAMLKAGMKPDINWHNDIIITSLPEPDGSTGEGYLILEGEKYTFSLYSLRYEDFIITTAITKNI